jgi:hypothetical protein
MSHVLKRPPATARTGTTRPEFPRWWLDTEVGRQARPVLGTPRRSRQ